MSRLERLGQWTAGGTSLRKLDGAGAGEGLAVADHHDHDADRGHDLAAWNAAEDDGDNRPGERLPVYRSEGRWRDPLTGDAMVTLHNFASEHAYVRGECVIGQGSQWQEAAALAYMATGPHDVRPRLLLLMHAEDASQLPAILTHGHGYLRGLCQRMGDTRSDEAMQAAALDALQALFDGRDRRCKAQANRWSVRDRSRSLAMRTADYGTLRRAMYGAYSQWLAEARERFTATADFVAPKTGQAAGSGHAPETWWRPTRLWRANDTVSKSAERLRTGCNRSAGIDSTRQTLT